MTFIKKTEARVSLAFLTPFFKLDKAAGFSDPEPEFGIGDQTRIPSHLPVLLTDNPQALQCEGGIHSLNALAHIRHERRKAPCGNDFGGCPHFRTHPLGDPIHKPGISVNDPGFDAVARVPADHISGRGEYLHTRQLGRGLKQCLSGYHDPRTDRAAQVFPFLRNGIKGGGRAKVNHHQTASVFVIRAHRVDDSVRAHLFGVAVEVGHLCHGFCIHPVRGMSQVFAAERIQNAHHGRNHTGNDGFVNFPRIHAAPGKQPCGQHIELVCGGVSLRADAPVPDQMFAVINSHYRVGVAHINHKKHCLRPFRMFFI